MWFKFYILLKNIIFSFWWLGYVSIPGSWMQCFVVILLLVALGLFIAFWPNKFAFPADISISLLWFIHLNLFPWFDSFNIILYMSWRVLYFHFLLGISKILPYVFLYELLESDTQLTIQHINRSAFPKLCNCSKKLVLDIFYQFYVVESPNLTAIE